MQTILSEADIKIRLMDDTEADYQLMTKWLADPRVYEFIHGKPKDVIWVKQKYGPRISQEEKVNACFIKFKNKLIGYIQYFDIKPYEKNYEMENTKNIWAVDMWIGEPDFWGKGIVSQTLKLLADYIFKNLGAVKIIIDPHVDNPRAIHAYEKAGFKKVKVLKAHEMYKDKKVDAWLMERTIDPSTHSACSGSAPSRFHKTAGLDNY